MSSPERIAVYDSRGEAYHRAFQVFLDHTDQKAVARAWLDRLVESLPARRVFIDAGAGDETWCIFDNTMHGAAIAHALEVQAALER